MTSAAALPLAIFFVTYLALALGKLPFVRLDRTGAAMVGAIAMVISGTLPSHAALDAIDFHTLALLLGMMILVADLRLSGVFSYLANSVFHRARSGYGLLALTVGLSGILAAFFVNDVVCLVLAPVVIQVARETGIDAVPLLLGLASASNIGSAATITGNPQNMIVAGFAHLPYLRYMLHVAPGSVAGLLVDYGIIAWLYRRSLVKRFAAEGAARAKLQPLNRLLAGKALVITAGALIGFALGFPTDLVALTAASLVLLIGHSRLERIYEQVDFTILLMFMGLFVVVAGARTTGINEEMLRLIGVSRLEHPLVLTGTVALLSNLVSNVPAVLLFRPLFPLLGGTPRLGMLLASASTYAGNLTLLGSFANLIVVESARGQNLEISFGRHLQLGIPLTAVTIAIAILILR